ncbi:ABC transporter permease [Pacificibacter sp. AS14]|uniref:ABC transporter permease n=1 Tax=Pacificibacter sp. AS14 TaxID=3135785 RepID=UPI00317317E6
MFWFLTKSLRAVITLLLVVTFVFFVLRLSGDPTYMLLPDDIDEATRTFYRQLWGLDKPIFVQYLNYLGALLQGDFGISFRNNQDAFQLVWDRVPKTALLTGTSLVISLVIGIPLGIVAALYRDSWIDRAVMAASVFGFSMPNFFLGILLILIFSLNLRVLPSSGSGTWRHLIMPASTLGISFAAQFARYTRSSMIDVLNKSYMRTAQSKGAGTARRVNLHALPNAAIPVITILGLKVGELLGGAVITETVFAWPGLGRLLTSAVASRDLAVVQCIMILLAITMVVANMLTDLTYGWLDPRVRVGAKAGSR